MSAWDRDTEQWRARLTRLPAKMPAREAVVREIERWLDGRQRCAIEHESRVELRAFGAEVYHFVKGGSDGDRTPISWYRSSIGSTRTTCWLNPYKVLDSRLDCPRLPAEAKEMHMTADMLAIAAALRGAGFEVGCMVDEILNDYYAPGHLHVYACADGDKLANVRRKNEYLDPVYLWVRLPKAEQQSCRCGEGCVQRP